MLVSDIINELSGTVLCGDEYIDQVDIKSACGADMMRDVYTYVKNQGMLLTGLTNSQVVHTAKMMGMRCVLFVRGKIPDAETIKLAQSNQIILIMTTKSMFHACGILYTHGIQAGERCLDNNQER